MLIFQGFPVLFRGDSLTLFTTFFVGVTSYEAAVKFAQMFGTWKKKQLCKCIVSVLIRKRAKTLFNIFRDSRLKLFKTNTRKSKDDNRKTTI